MFHLLHCRPETCSIRCPRRTRQNHTKTSFSFSYDTYVSYGRRSLLKIPNKAIYSTFWDNVNLPLLFPSEVELGSWSAFHRWTKLNIFLFLVAAHFIKGAIQKKNYCTLCRIAICSAVLHKEVILDFENLKIYRPEIQPCDHTLKAT